MIETSPKFNLKDRVVFRTEIWGRDRRPWEGDGFAAARFTTDHRVGKTARVSARKSDWVNGVRTWFYKVDVDRKVQRRRRESGRWFNESMFEPWTPQHKRTRDVNENVRNLDLRGDVRSEAGCRDLSYCPNCSPRRYALYAAKHRGLYPTQTLPGDSENPEW